MTLAGFLHSDTRGSSLLCSSPRRFAAYASFFGSLSLGIHRTPYIACFVASISFFDARSTRRYSAFKVLAFAKIVFCLSGFTPAGKGELYQSPFRLSTPKGHFF